MITLKNRSIQKECSFIKNKKVKRLISKLEINLNDLVEVPNTNGRVLTILDPNNDYFHSNGKYLYIGSPLSQLKNYNGNASPKMGKAELPIGKTIGSSRNRYNAKDPFVVTYVITVDNSLLEKHNVKTVRQLEEKIRKENGFVKNDNFDGDEYWSNSTVTELTYLINEYLFDSKYKDTYEPRIPQKRAIDKIVNAFKEGTHNEFLLGAIMSFGKNFTFLYSISEIHKNKTNSRVLVWTNKPGVYRSLKKDVNGHTKFSEYEYFSMKKYKDIQELPNKCVVTASKQLLENNKNLDLLSFID
jgi:hypothetical protein